VTATPPDTLRQEEEEHTPAEEEEGGGWNNIIISLVWSVVEAGLSLIIWVWTHGRETGTFLSIERGANLQDLYSFFWCDTSVGRVC